MNALEAKLQAIAREKARRRLYERVRYVALNGGQQRWVDEITRPGAFVVFNGSGNGGGKTFGLVALFVAVMYPDLAPAWAVPLHPWKYPKRARLVSTPKELEEVGAIQTTLKELMPKGRFEAAKKGKQYPSEFKTDTGWVLDLMSYEQADSEFAGPNIGLLGFNEPPKESIYRECLARLRKGGLCLGAMTSLNENPWVVDGILNKADGDSIRVVYSDVEENCRQHGTNGTLEHEQVEKILAQYDPDEREARKTGKPLAFSGAIFKTFHAKVHVVEKEPESRDAIYHVVDPAIGKPIASLWAAVSEAGHVHIFDEDPHEQFEGMKDLNLDPRGYVERFRRTEQERQVKVQTRILDRHFGNSRRTLGGLTLRQEFSEAGMDFTNSYTMDPKVEVETGILKVKEFLKYDSSRPMDSLNRPRLTVHPRCRNTIKALSRWSRDPKTRKPKEEFKDFADCVRYLVMSNPEVEILPQWDDADTGQAHYGVGNV